MASVAPRRRFRHFAAVVALAAAVAVQGPALAAGTAPRLVQAMLANGPPAAEARCSYTRIKLDDEATRQERFRADEPEPWQLVEVDGRAPTEAELRDYGRGADDRDRRHPLAFDLLDMVDPNHWVLQSETADRAVFGFRLEPSEELNERLVEKVAGTLVVDKVRVQPRQIVIENTDPVYAAPFVRVADYRQELLFEWNDNVGAAVLTQADTRWRGRALGLKVLRRHKLVRYLDYACEAPTSAG